MKKQITFIFIFLIHGTQAYSMQENSDIWRQIIFPYDAGELIKTTMILAENNDIEWVENNLTTLNESIKMFLACTMVCKYFNKTYRFPWANFELTKKNKLLQDINFLMTQCAYEEYRTIAECQPLWNISDDIELQVYKKYRVIPLALVLCGANPDKTLAAVSTTYLSKAVHAKDTLAVAMLLNHGADPYQMSYDEGELAYFISSPYGGMYEMSYNDSYAYPICFRASTMEMADLFIAKVDKQKLLDITKISFSGVFFRILLHKRHSFELMKLWIDYGIECPDSILQLFLHGYYTGYMGNNVDNFLQKVELLLAVIPHVVNQKDNGKTLIDFIEDEKRDYFNYTIKIEDYDSGIALLRRYGGKRANEF